MAHGVDALQRGRDDLGVAHVAHDQLGGAGQPAGPAFNADIGIELPPSVELRPVPDDVVARVLQTKDYRYAVADNRVLLVSPVTRYVVGVFMDDVQAPKASEGRRTP